MRQLILLMPVFVLAMMSMQVNAQDDEKTCNLWQTCAENKNKKPGGRLPIIWNDVACEDASQVTMPIFVEGGYAPSRIKNSVGIDAMAEACPFIDIQSDLCCNQDNAQIMQFNYDQLDAVFFNDCPICAVNLKRMWCEYACNSVKSNFLDDHGTTVVDEVEYAQVQVMIDEIYACGIFQSCEKESFIAQAGITSSVAFLDFMGSNGAPYSLSYINFTLVTDSTVENAMQGQEDVAWWPCEYPVPEDATISGYANLHNSSCSYCDAACTPPSVNDNIGFLDGLNPKLVGWSYGAFVIFTIIFQLLVWLVCEKKVKQSLEKKISEAEQGDPQHESEGGGSNNSNRNQGKLGRPLNVTDSHTQNSGMLSDNRLEDDD